MEILRVLPDKKPNIIVVPSSCTKWLGVTVQHHCQNLIFFILGKQDWRYSFKMIRSIRQEKMKAVRKIIPHIGVVTKVIPLKLFINMVLSSSADNITTRVA